MSAWDVVVVGGGIIGTAVARECAMQGISVALIEGGTLGGGATAAGMGHLVVMDDSPAQFALTSYSRSLWLEHSHALPSSVEFQQCGTIWVAADADEMAEVLRKAAFYEGQGVAASVLDEQELAREEPHLRPGLAGGLLVPHDAVVYPPAAASFYLDEAKKLGATIVYGRAISTENSVVRLEDGQTLHAERIVLAAGAATQLLPSLPVQKRKGHLVITDRYAGFARHQLVELGYLKSAHATKADSVAFNLQPRQTGQMLVGSSRQYGNDDPTAEGPMIRRMLDRAVAYMPELARLSVVRVWTGFRAATSDKLPLIGPATGLSDDPSLWLCAGFEGLGITNAPGAARLLLDSLLSRSSAIDATPYLPARFAAVPAPAYV